MVTCTQVLPSRFTVASSGRLVLLQVRHDETGGLLGSQPSCSALVVMFAINSSVAFDRQVGLSPQIGITAQREPVLEGQIPILNLSDERRETGFRKSCPTHGLG